MGFRPGWPGADARRRLGLLLSGTAGALAFPTGDWSLLAWVWLVPTLVSASERSPRGALADGWLAGLSFFIVLLRWLDHTFESYSAIPWPLTWLPIGALAAYCGLYVGVVSATVSWLGSRLGRGWGLATAPGLWVAGEWIRGWLMGGFPWGLLGYSQHRGLAVIQIAEIGGVYAVSLVIVAVNAALASWCVLGLRRSAPGATAAAVLAAGSLAFGWWVLAHEYGSAAGRQASSIEVAVIQPAIEQSLKWDPAHQAEALARYEQLTREAARSKPRVILWPETAAPIFLRGDPVLLSRLTSLSAELGVPILVGSIDRLPGPRGQFLNSAFLLGEQGITAKGHLPRAVQGLRGRGRELHGEHHQRCVVRAYERALAASGHAAPARGGEPGRHRPRGEHGNLGVREPIGYGGADVAPLRARLPLGARDASEPDHALRALGRLAALPLSRRLGDDGGGGSPSASGLAMLGDLKRDLADVEKQLQDLRGHL